MCVHMHAATMLHWVSHSPGNMGAQGNIKLNHRIMKWSGLEES